MNNNYYPNWEDLEPLTEGDSVQPGENLVWIGQFSQGLIITVKSIESNGTKFRSYDDPSPGTWIVNECFARLPVN